MNKTLLFLLFSVLPILPGTAQSNEVIGVVLVTDVATYGDAAYLLLSARGLIADEVGAAAAAGILEMNGYGFPGRLWGEPITLGEYAVLVQRMLGLPGGFMSAVSGAPRYAVRDLRHLRVIQGRAYADMQISGERMVRILGRALAYQEGTL